MDVEGIDGHQEVPKLLRAVALCRRARVLRTDVPVTRQPRRLSRLRS